MKILAFALAMLLTTQAHAGEIIVRVPEEKLSGFVRIMGMVNRLFNSDSKISVSAENVSLIADEILPIVSCGKVSGLSDIPAKLMVMKDSVIIQIPDADLRKRLDQSFSWCHVTQMKHDYDKMVVVSNTLLQIASLGRYGNLNEIEADISIRFDDPKYGPDIHKEEL